MRFSTVHAFLLVVFERLHHKQRDALASYVYGALFVSAAGVAAIGRSLAKRLGKTPKHAIKQFDRFLSRGTVQLSDALPAWARAVAAGSGRLVVALDWTEFAQDGHHMLVVSRVLRSGRAVPMMWLTARSDQLQGRMKRLEQELLGKLRLSMGPGRQIIVLADRAFGDVAFYQWLRDNGIDFVIRFRRCIYIHSDGLTNRAALLVPNNGRPRHYPNARIGREQEGWAHVVLVKQSGMKECWCLATSLPLHALDIIALYGRRFTTEETFRDIKDPRFGMALSKCRLSRTDRRDRMMLVLTIAVFLLTFLGQAAESLGLDRGLRANTVKSRTHSLFAQGRHFLDALRSKASRQRLKDLVALIGTIKPAEIRYAA